MTEKNENKNIGVFDTSSKFMRTLLIIVAALLIFAGPTYLIYVMTDFLKVNQFASMISGLAMLVVGLLLLGFLVRKKIIV
jgi:cytochrome c biogenesis protein CcdA